MPKRISGKTKQVYPCPPDKCNAKRHMPADSAFAVWDVMTGFAAYWQKQNNGALLFTASVRPTLANAAAMDPETVDSAIARLLRLDWLELVARGSRRRDGTVAPNTYRLRTHDEYVKLHPGSCPPYLCKPSEDAVAIRVPAKKMSQAEMTQFLQNAPQYESVRQTWSDIGAIVAQLTEEDINFVGEKEPTPVQTGEVASPVPADTTPVQTGADQSGSNPGTTPVQTPEPVRLEPEASPLITQTHHTHPITPPAASVCGVLTSNPSTKEAEQQPLVAKSDPGSDRPQNRPSVVEGELAPRAAVARLIGHGDGKFAMNITPNQRKQLEALATQFGGNVFEAAAKIWVTEQPWNSQTTHPYLTLIASFEGYVTRAKRVQQEKRDEAQTKINAELPSLLYTIDHCGPEFSKTLSQAEQDALKDPYSNREQVKAIAKKSYAWFAEEQERKKKADADAASLHQSDADELLKG